MKRLLESLLDDDDKLFNDTGNKAIIEQFLKKNYIIYGSYNINDDYIVDITGDIFAINSSLVSLTSGFTFGTVTGEFNCRKCKKLTSLKGAPIKVGGSFDLSNCKKLTSLKGAPKKINEYFNCSFCDNLKTLEGAPEEVGGDFICICCKKLTSLKGISKKIGTKFKDSRINCSYCDNLTSLEDAPKNIKILKY